MNFSAAQRSAIEHITGNLQLIACAGSGKTEVVARRVVTILSPVSEGGGGCQPQNVVAFTFTEKAAAELKERIYARCKERFGELTGLAEMYVGTIHGFCLELLKSEVPEYMKYEVLNEVQQILLVDRNSRESGLTQCTTLDGQSLRRYTDTERYVTALSILREDCVVDPARLESCSVAGHLSSYEALLRRKSYLDYSAILKQAVGALASNERLRERLRSRIRHVIVDEYQDVNYIQESVVARLHELGATLCIVGDDDQTLYQWRGSDVQNILTFADRYPGVTKVQLEENFRSSEGVISLARDFVRGIVRRLSKEMKPVGAQPHEPGDITALRFDSPAEEATHIAATCKALRGVAIRDGDTERGMAWSDMAILLRSVRRDGAAITEALSAAGVPFVVTGMDNLFKTPEAEAARQLFYFLSGEGDTEELRAVWKRADLGIGSRELNAAITSASVARDQMQHAQVGQFSVYNLQRQLVAFLKECKLREERVPRGRGEIVFYNLGKFSQAISDFESIHFHSKPVEKYRSFAGFLRYQAEDAYPEGWQDGSYTSPDAVRVMTIHQAKGLQWLAVFVPQLVRNRFPAKGAGGRTAWHLIPAEAFDKAARYKGGIEDERRLFYVAATRAQKFLHMSWAPVDGNRMAAAPSDFFTEILASGSVERHSPDYSARRRLPPVAKASVSSVMLSFSDIKYFFECPYQFKLRILYGFNAPLHEALGFGKSLHDALAEVHKRVLDGQTVAPEQARLLVERHLRTPFAYPALRTQLEAAAIRVVEGYIRKNASEFANLEFSEKSVEISFGNGVSVAGRIDLVKRLDTGEVSIVDLKSNERCHADAVTKTQLSVYALGYQELTGRKADYVETYELEQQRADRRPVDDSFIENVKRDVGYAAKALRQNELVAKPHKDTCGECDHSALCSAAVVD